jgi:glycerol uptake facilitator protein
MQPYVGEFLGTLILVLLGNGVVANVTLPGTKGRNSGWIVITMGWGMAVFVAVWCVGPISGAHINPAVTVGLAAADRFPWPDVPWYLAAQLTGALVGAVLVFVFYRDHYATCDDPDIKLGTFSTSPAIRRMSSNLFCEVIGTAVLVLAVLLAVEPSIDIDFATAASPMKVGLGTLGALPVGLLVFSIGLSLGGTTGFAINPARDLGPRIAHALLPIPQKRDSDWAYAWTPVVGPLLGSLLAVAIFRCTL